MTKRSEDVEATRRKITEAAVRLHTTIGPARTTVSALADEAGVTRLTVYRHFPDDESLFLACSQHWRMSHPAPDPADWTAIGDPRERLARAVEDVYAWYRSNAGDLAALLDDEDAIPPALLAAARDADEQRLALLMKGLRLPAPKARQLHAVLAHVLDFWTWHSLTGAGLTSNEACDVAIRFVMSCLGAPVRRRTASS